VQGISTGRIGEGTVLEILIICLCVGLLGWGIWANGEGSGAQVVFVMTGMIILVLLLLVITGDPRIIGE
jgi:hypothetical protein